MKKTIICTVCPMGCHIEVEGEGANITAISGHTCKRGEEYGRQEFVEPKRILTTTVKTDNPAIPLVPVRSKGLLPKDKIADCMEVIQKTTVKAPVAVYDVIIENICGTGIDIVATGTLK